MHKLIDGVRIKLTDNEIAEINAKEIVWESGEVRRDALSQIKALESTITDRRLREAMLGIDYGWLANVNMQIVNLRGQL